jgi:hypothetical protein
MRFATIVLSLVLPITAYAQVYMWKDANGKPHYSDQPPADRSVGAQRLRPTVGHSDDVEAVTATAKEKKEAAAKQAKEANEKAADAEQERAADQQRQENCAHARQNLAGIESGQIRFRMGSSGEREALDGDVRESELARARQAVDSNCSPRPGAKK